MVVAVMEKGGHVSGRLEQILPHGIAAATLLEFRQPYGQCGVVGIFNDYFLYKYMALGAQAQQPAEETGVNLHVEHYRILV